MTLTDVARTIRQDLKTLEGRFENIAKKFRSDILSTRNRMYPYVRFYEFKSDSRIHYHVAMRAQKRSDWKNPSMIVSGTYILKDGQYGFLVCPSLQHQTPTQTILVMTPHFITRYRERVHDNAGLTTDEIIRRFVRDNHTFYMNRLEEDHSLAMDKYAREGVSQLAVITPEGYCMAEKETYDCIRLTTFLTKDMLSKRQARKFDDDKEAGNNRVRILEITGIIKEETKKL